MILDQVGLSVSDHASAHRSDVPRAGAQSPEAWR
jgi:hypothetical protein